MGDCPRIHDIALRADFHAGSKIQDYYYDIDVRFLTVSFLRFIVRFYQAVVVISLKNCLNSRFCGHLNNLPILEIYPS